MIDKKILPELRLIQKRNPDVLCNHMNVFIIEKTRLLECRKCGQMVTPYDYLVTMAKQHNVIYSGVKILIGERNRLEKEVDELKRQRNNLKSQISRQTANLAKNVIPVLCAERLQLMVKVCAKNTLTLFLAWIVLNLHVWMIYER